MRHSPAARSDQLELGADVDRTLEAARDRTETGVEGVHPLGLRSPLGRDREPVTHVDALDDQYAVLGLDLADGLYVVALRIDFDLTRLQRAGEGAGQSAAGGGHHVVERGRVRRILIGLDAVVLGDLGMHAEDDRRLLGGEVGESLRPTEPLDPNPGNVRDHTHWRNSTHPQAVSPQSPGCSAVRLPFLIGRSGFLEGP